MTFVNENGLVQEYRYVDINPFIVGGKMGNMLGRFSKSPILGNLHDGGGFYPILSYSPIKQK